jgi:hypothetical protein
MIDLPYRPADPTTAQSNAFTALDWKKSLITSILSAGTLLGALMPGDLASFEAYSKSIALIREVDLELSSTLSALGKEILDCDKDWDCISDVRSIKPCTLVLRLHCFK